MKNVYVLFSGGLDSTYLVWKNLKDGNKVKPIYIELKNNESKSEVEKQQTQILIDEFRNEFGYEKIESLQIIASVLIESSNGVNFPQPFLWTTLIPFINNSRYNEIQIGYVLNDDAVSFLKEIKSLYGASQPFLREKLIPLKFPIIKLCKEDLLHDLPEKYVKYTTSCENPKFENYSMKIDGIKRKFFTSCGNCVSCKKIINNNYFNSSILEKRYNKHKNYRDENLITNTLLTLKDYSYNIEKETV